MLFIAAAADSTRFVVVAVVVESAAAAAAGLWVVDSNSAAFVRPGWLVLSLAVAAGRPCGLESRPTVLVGAAAVVVAVAPGCFAGALAET